MNLNLNKICLLGLVFLTLAFNGCNSNDENPAPVNVVPSAAAFRALHQQTLEQLLQHFDVEAGTGVVSMLSQKGVRITFNSSNLTLNGNPVTGTVAVEFMEIFDSGTMAAANKATMALMPDGTLEMLFSGGEFYINFIQNGVAVDLNSSVSLMVPGALSGGFNPDMQLWQGVVADSLVGNVTWNQNFQDGQQGNVSWQGNGYIANFGNLRWSNLDYLYQDPREKTNLLVGVPSGYDNLNSHVYILNDLRPNGLAQFATYTPMGYFTSALGIPIGLECHVIFVTELDGKYRYAIKPTTVVENGVVNISLAETTTGSAADFVAAVNAAQE